MNLNPFKAVNRWRQEITDRMLEEIKEEAQQKAEQEFKKELFAAIREKEKEDPDYLVKVKRNPYLLYKLMGVEPPPPTGGCR